MPRYRLEFDCNWSPQKVRQAGIELCRQVKFLAGVKNITFAKAAAAEPIPEQPRLTLSCRKYFPKLKTVCGEVWASDIFTPCPKCGAKQFVKKMVNKAA